MVKFMTKGNTTSCINVMNNIEIFVNHLKNKSTAIHPLATPVMKNKLRTRNSTMELVLVPFE